MCKITENKDGGITSDPGDISECTRSAQPNFAGHESIRKRGQRARVHAGGSDGTPCTAWAP